MRKILFTLLFLTLSSLAVAADKVPAHPHIEMQTSLGTIKLELDATTDESTDDGSADATDG